MKEVLYNGNVSALKELWHQPATWSTRQIWLIIDNVHTEQLDKDNNHGKRLYTNIIIHLYKSSDYQSLTWDMMTKHPGVLFSQWFHHEFNLSFVLRSKHENQFRFLMVRRRHFLPLIWLINSIFCATSDEVRDCVQHTVLSILSFCFQSCQPASDAALQQWNVKHISTMLRWLIQMTRVISWVLISHHQWAHF